MISVVGFSSISHIMLENSLVFLVRWVFYQESVFKIFQMIFFASIEMNTWIFFFLCSKYMVYYNNLFSYIKPFLSSWDKSYLVIVYNSLNVLLDLVCKYSVKGFCMNIHKVYCSVVFFSCGIFFLFSFLFLFW